MKRHEKTHMMMRLATIVLLLLFCMTQQVLQFESVKAAGKGIEYHGPVEYGGTKVGNFTVDGKRAFCLEHKNITPPSETAFKKKVHQNEKVLKALYYGWKGKKQWKGFTSEEKGIVCTSLVLSYYYSGKDSIITLGGPMDQKIGVSEFMEYLDSRPAPDDEFSLSKTAVTASLSSDKTRQQTEDIIFRADAGNTVTFPLPSGVTLYNRTTGKSGTGKVKVKGGDKFYLTAPLTRNGVWNSGKLKGTMGKFQPVVAEVSSGYQDIGYLEASAESEKTIQLSVRWVSYGDIEIYKFTGEGKEIKTPAAGVEFTLTHQDTKEKVKVVTDVSGYASTKGMQSASYPSGRLEGGVWKLEETRGIAGHSLIEPFTFTVSGQGNVYRYYIENRSIDGAVNLTKIDKDTKRPVLRPGTEFQILNEKKTPVSFTMHYPKEETFTSLYTADDGTLSLPEKLPAGTYYLKEIKAPEGYTVEENLIPFVIDKGYHFSSPLEIVSENEAVKGKIRIRKTEEGNAGKVLLGAEFDVKAAERIVTPDGTLRAETGEAVDHIVTGEDGTAETKELYPGKYILKETKAPAGYALSDVEYEAVIACKDQDTPLVFTEVEITNAPTILRVLKLKADEKAMSGEESDMEKDAGPPNETIDLTGEYTYLEGVEFRIWEKESRQTETYRTNEKGCIELKYLMPGIYYVQETTPLPGYVSDGRVHEVTVDENGRIEGNFLKQLNVENDLVRAEFLKLDEKTGQMLAGARLVLKDHKGKKVESWTTKDHPHRIEYLEPGNYVLHEEEAPKGYEKAKDIKVEIKDTKVLQRTVMYDRRKEVPGKNREDKVQKKTGGVKTGDDNRMEILILLTVISCFTVILCGRIAHRK